MFSRSCQQKAFIWVGVDCVYQINQLHNNEHFCIVWEFFSFFYVMTKIHVETVSLSLSLSYLSFRLLGASLPLLSVPQLEFVLSGDVMRHYGEHMLSAQVCLYFWLCMCFMWWMTMLASIMFTLKRKIIHLKQTRAVFVAVVCKQHLFANSSMLQKSSMLFVTFIHL